MDPESSSTGSSSIATDLNKKLETLELSYKEYVVPISIERATTKLPLIQRVPSWLRNRNPKFEKHYEPRVMAIGPIHHGKPGLREKYKLGLAHRFITNCFSEGEIQTAYHKITNGIKNLRNRYEMEVITKYNDDELAWMLFVDGCAVLASICEIKSFELEKNFTMKLDFVAHYYHDLFLLENQLPYEVLESLMNSSNSSYCLKKTVREFVIFSTYPSSSIREAPKLSSKPNHLLELLRSSLFQSPENSEGNICRCSVPLDRIIDMNFPEETNRSPTFRSITELKASGIRVKKSRTVALTDISFDGQGSLCATLQLPYMAVDDWTVPKFLNLVAYEMCPDFVSDLEISSYLCFMDSLIDKAEDVKELRDAGVLYNELGSDEDVAKFFNEISSSIPNFAFLRYEGLKDELNRHYNKKLMTWLAQFIHDHFSSPWSALALLGALIVLVLTFLQTLGLGQVF